MKKAINLAKSGMGVTAPNPSVACIIVNNHDNTIIAKGRTQINCGKHAEIIAMEQLFDRYIAYIIKNIEYYTEENILNSKILPLGHFEKKHQKNITTSHKATELKELKNLKKNYKPNKINSSYTFQKTILEIQQITSIAIKLKKLKELLQTIKIKEKTKLHHLENLTLYTTLEPCCHQGNNPPCVDAIINSTIITRVIIGTKDPNPLVSGNSIKKLLKAKIEVITDICSTECSNLILGFTKRISLALPYITMKAGITLDGKIALQNGKSKWITNSKQRNAGHRLRFFHDAILIGNNTLHQDNPELTCRYLYHKSHRDKPLTRVIISASLNIESNSNIFQTADKIRTIILTSKTAYELQEKRQLIKNLTNLEVEIYSIEEETIEKEETGKEQGLKTKCENIQETKKIDKYNNESNNKYNDKCNKSQNHFIIPKHQNKLNLITAMQKLCELGINSVLIEGGSQIFTSFLHYHHKNKKLIDQIIFFIAPFFLGSSGIPLIHEQNKTQNHNHHNYNHNEIIKEPYQYYSLHTLNNLHITKDLQNPINPLSNSYDKLYIDNHNSNDHTSPAPHHISSYFPYFKNLDEAKSYMSNIKIKIFT